jgi:iron complex transport system substrate-binding protein
MDRKLFIILFVLAMGMSACAPAGQVTPSGPISLTDGLDRLISLNGPAQRIVSIAPSNTEILFAIGAGEQVVGRDELSDYPAQVLGIGSVGGSMGQYSTEAILALQPDLVLATELNSPELVKTLEDLGLTVYYLNNPATLEEMYTNLETVATLAGRESEADVLIRSLKTRVAVVDEKIKEADSHPAVFYELDSTDPAKPWTAGPGSFIDLLLARAGGENIGSHLDSEWAQISLEQLVVLDPELILLGDAMWGVTAQDLKSRPGWESLAAVKNDRIYPFDDNLVSRPGPRMVDGLEQLAKLLHPELFS